MFAVSSEGKGFPMPHTRLVRSLVAVLAGIGLAAPAAPMATAQEATPVASAALDVPLIDASGEAVGLATFSENAGGVTLTLLVEGLAPGEHGWHLHEVGVCEPVGGAEPFAAAGGHWNPARMPHGGPDDDERHAGDFGNLTAGDAGLAEMEITTTHFTLGSGETSVFDEDGTAIIVHEAMDDLTTQPGGDSGARYACGVVAATMIAPAATPVGIATPVG